MAHHWRTLAVALDGPAKEVRLFTAGWNDTTKGRFLFDDKAAKAVMRRAEKHGVDIMIDLEHLSLDADSPSYDPDARGWGKLAVRNGELWVVSLHINEYDHGSAWNHDPERPRKLLLHKQEIKRLIGKIEEQGLTLVPLSIYFKNGYAKIELGLARGRKLHDKRHEIAKRDVNRDIQREIKSKLKM